MNDQQKIQAVEKIIDAWNRINLEDVAEMFTEDGIMHSVMKEPRVGRAVIYESLKNLRAAKPGSKVDIQVKHIGVIDGLVFTERLDKLVIDGKAGEIPVIGIFEVKEGKIAHWREYYDLETMRNEIGPSDNANKA